MIDIEGLDPNTPKAGSDLSGSTLFSNQVFLSNSQAVRVWAHCAYLSIFLHMGIRNGAITCLYSDAIEKTAKRALEYLARSSGPSGPVAVAVRNLLAVSLTSSINTYVLRKADLDVLTYRIETDDLTRDLMKWLRVCYSSNDEPVEAGTTIPVYGLTILGEVEPNYDIDPVVVNSYDMNNPPFWRFMEVVSRYYVSKHADSDDTYIADDLFTKVVSKLAFPLEPGGFNRLDGETVIPLPNAVNTAILTALLFGRDTMSNSAFSTLRRESISRFYHLGYSGARICGEGYLRNWYKILTSSKHALYAESSVFSGLFDQYKPKPSDTVSTLRASVWSSPAFETLTGATEADDDESSDTTNDDSSSSGDDADMSDVPSLSGDDTSDDPDDPDDTGTEPGGTDDTTTSDTSGTDPTLGGAPPVGAKDSIDYIHLDSSNSGSLNDYLYRCSVAMLNRRLLQDDDARVSHDVRSKLSWWCRNWIWLATVEQTENLMKALGFQDLLKALKPKG